MALMSSRLKLGIPVLYIFCKLDSDGLILFDQDSSGVLELPIYSVTGKIQNQILSEICCLKIEVFLFCEYSLIKPYDYFNNHYNQYQLLIIFIMSKKDLFGFATQGINYQIFRPKYPASVIGECLRGLKLRNNYLDVATGTGQLLFNLCGAFNGTIVGTDISEKMLQTAQKKAYEYESKSGMKIHLQKKDCLATFPNGLKFDLITVGQALHWFDIPKFIDHSKSLLNPGGRFACMGYILNGIAPAQSSAEALEGGKLTQEFKNIPALYDEFYKIVKPHFDFDRDELERSYTDPKYNFQQHYVKVDRVEDLIMMNVPTKVLIGYLKTYSGYNTYVEKSGKDPILIVEKGLSNVAEVAMLVKYFGVYCYQPI